MEMPLPNPKDKEMLKLWFEQNQDLTTLELATKAGVSPSTIRNWKRSCGLELGKSPFDVSYKMSKKNVEKVDDPIIWDNKSWFEDQYRIKGRGIYLIARVIGRSTSLVKGRLDRYGIPLRSHSEAVKSKSPYCNKEWLELNYIELNKSLAKCAEEAGVSPYTICNWLAKFDIPIRDIHEAMAGRRNPFHGKKHSEETKRKIREAYRENRQNKGEADTEKA